MSRTSKKTRVLFVDQAIDFGGTVKLVATFAERCDAIDVEPIIITALDPEKCRGIFGSRRVLTLRQRLTYRDRQRWMQPTMKHSVHLQRLVAYAFTLTAFFVNFGYIFGLLRAMLLRRVDIIHINNCATARLLSAVLRKKFIVHVHGVMGMRLSPLDHWVHSRASAIVAISHTVAESLRDMGYPVERVVTIYNGVPQPAPVPVPQVEALRSSYSFPQDARVIGVFGRLIPSKGQMEVLLAFRKLLDAQVAARLLLVGDGSDFGARFEQEIRAYVRDHNLSSTVVFAGFQSDVTPFLALCDIVVHSATEPEGFGLVIAEAMLAHRAVIASPIGAGKELIEDGVTGRVVDPNKIDELYASMRSLIEDDATRLRFASAGKAYALQNFTAEAYVERFGDLYRRILGGTALATAPSVSPTG